MTLRQSTLSKEYVVAEYSCAYDPTSLTVQMAFPSAGVKPVSGDWKSADWDPGFSSSPWAARCLVGPGGTVELSSGSYDVWIKVSGPGLEVPADPCGYLVIE